MPGASGSRSMPGTLAPSCGGVAGLDAVVKVSVVVVVVVKVLVVVVVAKVLVAVVVVKVVGCSCSRRKVVSSS